MLLERISHFVLASFSHTKHLVPRSLYFFVERESLCPFLVFISKEAFSAKCYFESHGPVWFGRQKGLAWFCLELEKTVFSVFWELAPPHRARPLPCTRAILKRVMGLCRLHIDAQPLVGRQCQLFPGFPGYTSFGTSGNIQSRPPSSGSAVSSLSFSACLGVWREKPIYWSLIRAGSCSHSVVSL